MKLGVNLWIWESPFRTDRHLGLLAKVKALRAEVVEFTLEEGGLVEAPVLRRELTEQGLACSIIGLFGQEGDLSSPDAGVRKWGMEYARKGLALSAEVGATIFSGAGVGVGGMEALSHAECRQRYQIAAECLHQIGEFASQVGVRFCLEILNRYEDNILNTAAQACELMDMADHPAVGIHLDTFHMNMEEGSMGDAIRLAGHRLFHLHSSESNRGKPGGGHLPWGDVAEALRQINYGGFAVIESFNPVGRLAPHARSWRPYAESQDILAAEGLAFLWETLHK